MSRFEYEEELERRLRAIGAAPTPMPGSINRFMRKLPEGYPMSVSRSRRPGLARLSRARLFAGGLAALAAIALVAVVSATLLIPYNRNASSPSPSASPSPSVSPSASASASPFGSATPLATPSASTYDFSWTSPLDAPSQEVTTPGADPGTPWTRLKITGFSSTDPALGSANAFYNRTLSHWSRGWVIYGFMQSGFRSGYIWESADGLTWRAVGAPGAQAVPSAVGLTVISDDGSMMVWVSADGLRWTTGLHATGLDGWTFNNPSHVSNLGVDGPAGSPIGIVTPAGTQFNPHAHPCDAGESPACDATSLLFSATGENWQDVTPKVDGTVHDWVANWIGQRFVALGLLTANGASSGRLVAYWSADGRSWTPAATPNIPFTISDWRYGNAIEVARGGAILPCLNFWLKTTDGTSWARDENEGPLGKNATNWSKANGELFSNTDRFLARTLDGQAWTSFDGQSWTKLAEPLPPHTRVGVSPEVSFLLPRGYWSDSKDGYYWGAGE